MAESQIQDGDIGRRGVIKTRAWGHMCPFRGAFPIQVKLDERCPEFVACHIIPVDLSTAREARALEAHPIPILREDSYCGECVTNRIREVEAGITYRERKAGEPSHGSAIRRSRRKKAAAKG